VPRKSYQCQRKAKPHGDGLPARPPPGPPPPPARLGRPPSAPALRAPKLTGGGVLPQDTPDDTARCGIFGGRVHAPGVDIRGFAIARPALPIASGSYGVGGSPGFFEIPCEWGDLIVLGSGKSTRVPHSVEGGVEVFFGQIPLAGIQNTTSV